MSLIEVIVALALFAVIGGSVLTLLGGATTLGRDSKYRLAAVSLANRELEITRDSFASVTRGPTSIVTNQVQNPTPLPGGTQGEPLVVDNVPYTVTRTAQWSQVGTAAASTCDEGGSVELSYLRVRIEVTWPGLGDRIPVSVESVLTPPKGTYSSATGHMGIKVIDSDGTPEDSIPVTIVGPSGTFTSFTASDGCAIFAFLYPGTYKATVSRAGYVNRNGDPTGQVTAQVQTGQLWRTTIEYDRATELKVHFVTESGFNLPSPNTIPVSLGNSALVPSGAKAFPGTGNDRVLDDLWAYPSGYQAWAGQCLDNDPQYNGSGRNLPVTVTRGESSDVNVRLEPLQISGAAGGATITAVESSDSSCPSGQTIRLGTASGGGTLMTSLPVGDWRIVAGSRDADVSITPADGPETAAVN